VRWYEVVEPRYIRVEQLEAGTLGPELSAMTEELVDRSSLELLHPDYLGLQTSYHLTIRSPAGELDNRACQALYTQHLHGKHRRTRAYKKGCPVEEPSATSALSARSIILQRVVLGLMASEPRRTSYVVK